MDEALERGVRLAGATRNVNDVNLAFWTRDFDQIVFETMQGRVDSDWLCDTVTTCRQVERELRESIAEMLEKHGHPGLARRWRNDNGDTGGADPLAGLEPLQSFSAAGDLSETRMAIAAVRIALGAMVEAAFVKEAVQTCWVMPKPGRATLLGKSKVSPEAWAATADGKRQLCAARLYNDAAIVATWTSAHTAFVDDCQLGVLEAPSPSIFTVLSSFTEFNFSDLLARRVVPKHKDLKDALPVLSLLMRGLHTSARGWDVLLSQFVPKSTCVRTIVGRALAVSCTGMHENVHPALRLPWRRRHVALKLLFRECTSKRLPDLTKTATTATREAVRRLLMSTVACMPAATRALALSAHPIRMLQSPPLCAPAPGAEACAEAFASATQSFLSDKNPSAGQLADALTYAFDEPMVSPRQRYDINWLGKGSAPVSMPTPFVTTAAGVFASAFRANFLPLWLHAFHHGQEMPRLEAIFHSAVHELNAATALVAELDEKTALHMQRLAIGHVSSALLSAEDVMDATGLSAELCKFPLAENELDVDYEDRGKGLGPTDDELGRQLAMALSWARAAWVSEKVRIYELGPRTTGMQILAILRRLSSTKTSEAEALPLGELGRRKDEFLDGLPKQATHLQACLACGRVANPVVNFAKPGTHFDDVGASVAMNCTACDAAEADYGKQHLRCAKRASAALRTAVLYEASSTAAAVEQKPVDGAAAASSITWAGQQKSTASGVGARAKRDAKTGMTQRRGPKGCGDDPLLVLPLVGRCIALSGVKYALCAFCAACVQVDAKHRAGGEICCLRCDGRVAKGFAKPAEEEDPAEHARVCRFCGKVERNAGTHRSYKAPHDIAGNNERLPPPLRTVHFCPQHQKSWLQQALRTLPTRSVLAHISYGARPMMGASLTAPTWSNAELGVADDVGVQEKKGKKRKAAAAAAPAE